LSDHEIVKRLREGDLSPQTRQELVADLERRRATWALSESLASVDVRVRASALRALARIGTPEAIESISNSLEAGDTTTVGVAADLLWKANARESIPSLVKVLETRQDLGSGGRDMVIFALGRMPHRSAVPALSAALMDECPSTRRFAARALAGIRTPEAGAALDDAVSSLSWYEGRRTRRALRFWQRQNRQTAR